MLKDERLEYILKKLNENRKVLSMELSQELQVSDDTIRRDLNELAENGFIKKVHGGAIPKPTAPYNLSERLHIAEAEKQIIAEKAVKLFLPGQVIILDNGSTNLLVAKLLPENLNATIFTNSLPIAHELVSHPNIEIVMLGGKIYKEAQAAVGLEVMQTLSQIRADWCLIGVCSIHHEVGISSQDWSESQIKRKMTEVSQKIIATTTYDKINTAEHYIVCNYSDLDVLITDNSASEEVLRPYLGKGVEVL